MRWGGFFRLKHHLKPKKAEIRSFFIEVVFLRSGGVFRLKHHLRPKKAEIIYISYALDGGGVQNKKHHRKITHLL